MKGSELKFKCIECGAPTKYNNGKCSACYDVENKSKPYEPSEGEEYLADYFEMLDFEFEEQVEIKGLKNDSKKYRIADFYRGHKKLSKRRAFLFPDGSNLFDLK